MQGMYPNARLRCFQIRDGDFPSLPLKTCLCLHSASFAVCRTFPRLINSLRVAHAHLAARRDWFARRVACNIS